MSAVYVEGVGKARCLEDILKASGGYLECVRKITGKNQDSDSDWRLPGRYLESIKIILSV